MCEEVGDYEGVREDLERMLPGASANGAFAMALVKREQEFASDCARSAACAWLKGVFKGLGALVWQRCRKSSSEGC